MFLKDFFAFFRTYQKARKTAADAEAGKKALLKKGLDYEYLINLFRMVQDNADTHVVVKLIGGEEVHIYHGANETERKQRIYDYPDIKEEVLIVQ